MTSFFSRKIRCTFKLLCREDEVVTCMLTGSIVFNYPAAAYLRPVYLYHVLCVFFSCLKSFWNMITPQTPASVTAVMWVKVYVCIADPLFSKRVVRGSRVFRTMLRAQCLFVFELLIESLFCVMLVYIGGMAD